MRALLIISLAAAALTAGVTLSSAHPPAEPEHGLNESVFYPLWAGDTDVSNQSALQTMVGNNTTALHELTALTDIPFNDPPEVVEDWNRAEHAEFPETNRNTSLAPEDATLKDGTYIRDAHASIFTLQPSTRARVSPSEQPLYVAPNGSLLGTVDYRVASPEDTESENRTVTWELTSHDISTATLLVDGTVEDQTTGSHTPRLSYESLDEYAGSQHRLTLQATIDVTLRKETRECLAWKTTGQNGTAAQSPSGEPSENETANITASAAGNTTSGCSEWEVSSTRPTETITVSDSESVSVYTLSVSGFHTRYPDGDLGVVVFKNKPWLGISSPVGDVRGSWRFYSARNPAWDTLLRRSESETSDVHSPLHPLGVTAYPQAGGPVPSPRTTVSVLRSYGEEIQAPSLPENIALDVPSDPYTASFGLASRIQSSETTLRDVRALGLVRGVTTNLDSSTFSSVPFHRSNLTVAVVNSTAGVTTVEISLRDANTGNPIQTAGRDGFVEVAAQRANTDADGRALIRVESDRSSFVAQYKPDRWWDSNPAYLGDSDITYKDRSAIGVLTVIYETSIPIGVFLLGVFLLSRATGWEIWPPWGRR